MCLTGESFWRQAQLFNWFLKQTQILDPKRWIPLRLGGEIVRLKTYSSNYHYIIMKPRMAVFSGPPVYSPNAVETQGGELTFDWLISEFWKLKGGYSYSKGKIDSEVQSDFSRNDGKFNFSPKA